MILCGALTGTVTHFDGELVHLRAFHGATPEATDAMKAAYPIKAGRGAVSARAIRERAPVQIPDVFEAPEYELMMRRGRPAKRSRRADVSRGTDVAQSA